jgi:citrate synthase
MSETAKLILEGKTYELPVLVGTENEKAIDISKLRSSTGYITLDPGLANTGSCRSSITLLDGEIGILRYRGYPIEELAAKSTFLETSYLLINGELPSAEQIKNFRAKVSKYSELPDGIIKILDHYPPTAHPMGVVSAVTASLSAFYPQYIGLPKMSPEMMDEIIAQILGQVKIIVSYFYRKTKGQDAVKSDPRLGYAADFLNMMFHGNGTSVDPEVARALDVLLILHADHEQNCSASTVRIVGSSKVNPFACTSAGIDALWGQLHGGANQAVLEMLETIKKEGGGNYRKYLDMAKDKNSTFKLMGFGHRVYKNFDPRAKLIKDACHTVLEKLGVKDPLLDIAKGLEEAALADDYFVERKLYPNVDFYSGIIYRALGIPTNMFTCMFVLGRVPGWLAQWKEMRLDADFKISRPRQIYLGATTRPYTPVEERK